MSDDKPRTGTHRPHKEYVRRAITINKPLAEVEAFWAANGGEARHDHVRFVAAPGGRGTEVHITHSYQSPGPIGKVISVARHAHPDQQVRDELGAFKAILETGDIVLSDAWVNGPHDKHPSRPDASATAESAHASNQPETNA